MIQTDQLKFNPDAIAALKAATRQVVQSEPSATNFGSPAMSPVVQTTDHDGKSKQKLQSKAHPPGDLAEAFVEKITSVEQAIAEIEQEQLVVDQELSRVEQLQSDLIAKKKQLENRSHELITVKDKLTALDKELSEVLKLPAI